MDHYAQVRMLLLELPTGGLSLSLRMESWSTDAIEVLANRLLSRFRDPDLYAGPGSPFRNRKEMPLCPGIQPLFPSGEDFACSFEGVLGLRRTGTPPVFSAPSWHLVSQSGFSSHPRIQGLQLG